ncbi:sigma-54-dependent Fis family transcriptional regulator [Caproiciproducens sp. NJN-50]|uniref:sigma-54-dependent Fis family transcriptional regulator n=1 Tax=Caproiciproducens sp. NJN-50 TaxID=2507162 RepID=UPI0013E89989|nr:PrpR N-terminal domain-containing protein [Caproiciproducens sp. NJN-50]
MGKILLVASGDNIAKYAYQLQSELNFPPDFEIINLHMEQALYYVRSLLKKEDGDIDVVIARGNTAKLLRDAKISAPVVTIPISDSEILAAVRQARESAAKEDPIVGYIGLQDVVSSVRHFLETLKIKARLYQANSSAEIEKSIIRAQREQVDVLIGGVYTCQILESIHVKHVLLESSLASVREAYHRAREVQRNINLQRKRLQEKNTILNTAVNGVVSINESGIVTSINQVAADYLHTVPFKVVGKHFTELLDQEDSQPISSALSTGEKPPDFLLKRNGDLFLLSVNPILVNQKARGIVVSIQKQSSSKGSDRPAASFGDAIGQSEQARQILDTAREYSEWDLPVLLIGETGTGKRFWAECIHSASRRSSSPFVSIDCSMLSRHNQPSGRTLSRLLQSADGGTAYFAEIWRLPPEEQALMADFLEEKRMVLPDAGETVSADVRIIASSSRDLSEFAGSGRFNQSLYHTLNTLPLPLSSLRQRRADIPAFAQYAANRASSLHGKEISFSPEALEVLQNLSWEGNLDQLFSFCQRLTVLTRSSRINANFVRIQYGGNPFSCLQKDPETSPAILPTVQDTGISVAGRWISCSELCDLERHCGGNRTLMAEKLGVSRTTLWKHLKRLSSEGNFPHEAIALSGQK